ncbi:MAG: hypothetical protein QOI91_819 [Solirubrobacteraceae bacterium]|nr:hypothetical protein [Solirubrobacteraceae bacterium]
MRKLLAATALATASVLAGPIAGASAAPTTFEKPNCQVYGTATFDDPLKGTASNNMYHFTSSREGSGDNAGKETLCSGIVNGTQMTAEHVRVKVDGAGSLSCAHSEGKDAQGYVTFLSNNVTLPFKLDITGVLTEVALTVKGETSGSDSGTASFHSDPQLRDPAKAGACGPTGEGFKSLTFEAMFNGSETLVSPGPASTGGGGGGSTGGGGGSTGGGGGGSTTPVATRFTFRAAAQKLKTALTKGIAVTLKGNAPARADLKGQVDKATAKRYGLGNGKKPVVVAIGRIALTHAGQAKGYLKLTNPAKRKLKNAKNVKVTLVGTVSDATRHQTKVNKTVLLR